MNPTGNENPGLNLPPPIGEPLPSMPSAPEGLNGRQEAAPNTANRSAGLAMPAPPIPAMYSQPNPAQAQSATPTNDVVLTMNPVVQIPADDGDLIEKEWVNKAKQIVESNRDDPHKQSAEITVFKADYLKQRYNKSIKISEQ